MQKRPMAPPEVRSSLFHVKTGLMAAGIGGLYAAWIAWTGWMAPCPFLWLTGWCCPGCGMTHLVLDVMQGNFADALQQNLAVSFLLLLWLLPGPVVLCLRSVDRRRKHRIFQILIWFSVAVLVLFGVLRNLPGFSFLLPLYMR